jgi:anti-sigma factor RsiW
MQLYMSRALDGDLAAHEMAELSAHLAGCASCRARSLDMNAADGLFRELGHKRSAPPEGKAVLTRQVMERVRREAASIGGIREFARLVVQDQALQDQIRLAASPDAFVELFVSLGRQRGYRFGSGEVLSLLAARQAANDDLSDEQLDAVVGGVSQTDMGLYAFIDDLFPNGFK